MQKVTARLTPAIAFPKNLPDPERKETSTKRVKQLLENSIGRFGLYQCLRPLAIGLVHGLAGSAAVALLVLSTIHNPVWATAYLLIFGAGTMLGMMCMTAAIAIPFTFAGDRFRQTEPLSWNRLRDGESLFRIFLGLSTRLSRWALYQPSAMDS